METPVRPILALDGNDYVVACDLARPINRKAIHRVGWTTAADSERILATFQCLLAR